MIEMSMCDQHLLDRHAMMLGTLQQTLRLAAGIDQRTPHSGVVPDQRTILLERRDRHNFAAQAHVRDTDCAPLAGGAPVSPLGRRRFRGSAGCSIRAGYAKLMSSFSNACTIAMLIACCVSMYLL